MRGGTVDRLFVVALVAVVAWRIFTAWHHYEEVGAGELGLEAAIGRWWLAGLGLVHAAFACWARWRVRTRAGALYASWAICTALHWGWLPGLAWQTAGRALITLYFVVSGMLSAAFLFRFTLALPPAWRGAEGRRASMLIYAPPVLGLALALPAVIFPAGNALGDAALALFWRLESAQSALYGLAALGILSGRWMVASGPERRARRLALAVWVPLLGAAPWLLSMAGLRLPLPAHLPPTFFFVLVPPALAACLVGSERFAQRRIKEVADPARAEA